MAGLQRTATSFRRQGSSGFVWDDKFLAQELNIQLQQQQDLNQGFTCPKESDTKDMEKGDELRRIKSVGGRTPNQTYRTVKVEDQVEDPSSPRVAACDFCGVFGRFPAWKVGNSGKTK